MITGLIMFRYLTTQCLVMLGNYNIMLPYTTKISYITLYDFYTMSF